MSTTVVSRLVAYQLAALALKRPPALSRPLALVLVIVHTLGLALVAQVMHAPLLLVVGVVGVLFLGQFHPRTSGYLEPGILAPFWFVYALVAVRFVWLRVLGAEIPGYFDYLPPDPRVLLNFEFLVGAALLYSAAIAAARVLGSPRQAITALAVLTACGVFLWAAVEYIGHRTLGASGSDPFAYVQMGIDLATNGTAAHRFQLFPLVSSTSLAWFPIVHVGYHLPYNLSGNAVTVWSIGGSIAYALAYLVAGESALYLVNPLFSLASIVVSGWLAWELTRQASRTVRLVTTCLTAALVATSNEIVNWAGVTMVDTQALVWSTLAFIVALKLYRTGKWGWAVGAGLCWGAAFFVRHTQLLIALGFVPLLLTAPFPIAARIRNAVFLGIAAFVTALPDLWYHQTYLGGWLTPESKELALFSWDSIPPTAQALSNSAFIGSEFGWLLLFIILGILSFTRRDKILSAALLLWLTAILAVHLPYPALRLRDLVAEFPILAFYASDGLVALLRTARRWLDAARAVENKPANKVSGSNRTRQLFRALGAFLMFLALELALVRVWNTVPRVAQEPPARFGGMTAQQRESFNQLAELVPSNAIIGASLNSGAIELYSRRNAFRPADWCTESQCNQLESFVEIAHANEYEIYLLQDNASLAAVLDQLEPSYQVELVTTLDVPLFGTENVTESGTLWKITKR